MSVNYAADKYLKVLVSQGLTVPTMLKVNGPNIGAVPAYESGRTREFVAKIDAEFKATRFEASATPQFRESVIKSGHKYLYSDEKWTYDIKLAKRFRQHDAAQLVRHFEGATVVPAPPILKP